MLLLDQVHTAVAKGKSFQTSPPPEDSDPEDPWKVQVAKAGPPRKHVWVSWHSIRAVHCPLKGRRSFCVASVADGCLCSLHHFDCVCLTPDPLCDLQTKTGSDPASRAFVGLLVHSAAGEHSIDALLPCCCPSCGTWPMPLLVLVCPCCQHALPNNTACYVVRTCMLAARADQDLRSKHACKHAGGPWWLPHNNKHSKAHSTFLLLCRWLCSWRSQ